jgi:hypothetical protein
VPPSQWEALFLLVAGITINQLGAGCPAAATTAATTAAAAVSQHGGGWAAAGAGGGVPLLPAVLCTLGTVTVPSAASVYNEYALKRHMDTSVHLQVG